jgi:hypothetical protein
METLKMRDLPPSELDTIGAWGKIALAWLAYFIGSLTLSNLGMAAALVFTILQIIVLLRDKFGFFNPKGK